MASGKSVEHMQEPYVVWLAVALGCHAVRLFKPRLNNATLEEKGKKKLHEPSRCFRLQHKFFLHHCIDQGYGLLTSIIGFWAGRVAMRAAAVPGADHLGRW